MSEAGIDGGPLIPSDVRVTRLYLTSITTTLSRAVKIEMTVESEWW